MNELKELWVREVEKQEAQMVDETPSSQTEEEAKVVEINCVECLRLCLRLSGFKPLPHQVATFKCCLCVAKYVPMLSQAIWETTLCASCKEFYCASYFPRY
jgi:hypothetical protein